MEVRNIIVAMTICGVVSAVGEKLLISFGKMEMATFCNIAGLSGIGLSCLALVGKLIHTLATL